MRNNIKRNNVARKNYLLESKERVESRVPSYAPGETKNQISNLSTSFLHVEQIVR